MSTISTPLPVLEPKAASARRWWALGGVGFTSLFMAADVLGSALRVGELPMPDAPVSELIAYQQANTASTLVAAPLQILAGVALLFLVLRAFGDMRAGLGARIAKLTGRAAAMTLAISGAASIAMTLLVDSVSPGTMELLREINFRTGGVVHVVMLGLFVGLWCLNSTGMGKATRVTGKVLAVPAIGSITSVLWFYASALLPLGRFTLMGWLVFAAVGLLRRAK